VKTIAHIINALMPGSNFDCLGVGVIDFKQGQFEALEVERVEGELLYRAAPKLFYDLASLTKPLTNSLSYFLRPEAFGPEALLCLDHRGGLPAWGLLPRRGWREQILAYPVKESAVLYSDFSALRVMLELEKKGIDQASVCRAVWDPQTVHWTELKPWDRTPQYGHHEGHPNKGRVHDPNARNLRIFCSHAGLFSTVPGLCRTLLTYQEKTGFIQKVAAESRHHPHRFVFGWDRVENPAETLAGRGCGPSTFGHLGFTGTSIWIDPDLQRGHVILANATKDHWFAKQDLNDLRRAIGETVWKG
jgi:CubicO group peptidase (beta-lactamase class C family)